MTIKVHKDMLDKEKYSWAAIRPDDPHKVKADAIMFNRKEGYEVELMIQKICDQYGYESIDDVKRIEAIIANELPGNVRSQEHVHQWLVEYIDSH